MQMQVAVLVACLAIVSGEDAPHGYEPEPHSDVTVPAVASDLAIFLAKTSAATATSFVLEHTKVTITKHAGSSSSALSSGRRPRIIVTDAAARGLVCIPKGRLTKKDSSAAEAETIDSSDLVEEEGKAGVVIGQGKGVTASASSGGASAAASASSGGAAAAASSGGSAAAASSGDAQASATSAEGSSASAASSGDSAAAATSGDAQASATSAEGSSASAASSGDSAAAATSGDAEASALSADGSLVSASSSDDSAAAASSGDAEASATSSGGKSASVTSSDDGAAAATAGDAEASATSSDGSSASATSSGDSTAAATSGDAQAEASSSSSHSSASSQEGGYDVDVGGEDAHASATDASGSTISTSTDGKSSEDLIIDGYCECVPDYLCDDEGYINTFGAGLIDIRFNTKKAIRQYDSRCKQGQTCCRHREGEERSAIGWLPTACGTRAPMRLDRRVVRGEAVRIGENPWMVAIMKEVANADGSVSQEYLCGGSLVEEDIVLTGAHCVHEHKGDQLIVRVGEWDTSSDDEVYPHQDISVSRVLEHGKFNPKTLFNDVAVLKLSELVEIAPHVGTICLPEDLSQVNLRDCVATGWGKESFSNGVYASILKEVPLSVVDSGDCQAALRTTRLSRFFRLHKSFTCAGGEPGVDTCKGDGGSPLVCRGPPDADGEDTFVQVGIVAWGIGCGKDGIPGVYADVRKLLPWIHEHIAELHGSGSGGYRSAPLSGDDDGGAGDDLGSSDDALASGNDDALGHSHGY